MRSENLLSLRSLFFTALSFLVLQSCVNPPQRTSGVNPAPARTPPKDDQLPPPTGDVNGDRTGFPPAEVPPVAPPAEKVKVSYWLNPTDNNNCLTIQVEGASAPVTAPCTGTTRPTERWFDNLYPGAGSGAFKASLKVETTDKSLAKTETSSENLGANAWRWRCVSRQDPVTKINVHTACYEDGNALAKTFDSSDLFVQVVGPATVDFGSIQCTKAADIDLNKCAPK